MAEDVLLAALRDDPGNELTWSALADWLEESREGPRAELLRLTRRALPMPIAERGEMPRRYLELAVLSACETGVGDLGGGDGVFGLQRAFHYAGARNVVANLWMVDDAATAALMGEFYRNLWEENRPPIEALRRAQLAVYRADPKRFGEMARRGFGDGTKDLKNLPVLPADPRNPSAGNRPALWAAFTLSGRGGDTQPPVSPSGLFIGSSIGGAVQSTIRLSSNTP